MHLLCTYMFLHCTNIFQNTYMCYNYTLTSLKPTYTNKPVPNLLV